MKLSYPLSPAGRSWAIAFVLGVGEIRQTIRNAPDECFAAAMASRAFRVEVGDSSGVIDARDGGVIDVTYWVDGTQGAITWWHVVEAVRGKKVPPQQPTQLVLL